MDSLTSNTQRISINESLINNVKDAVETLLVAQNRFIKTQCIVHGFERLTNNNSSVSCELSDKIGEILLSHYFKKEHNGEDKQFDMLGLTLEDFNDVDELTSLEKASVKSSVKEKLASKSTTFCNRLKELGDCGLLELSTNITGPDTLLSDNKTHIVKLKNEYLTNVDAYKCVVDNTNDLLDRFINIKYNTTTQLCYEDESAEELELKARLLKGEMEHVLLSANNKAPHALTALHNKMKLRERETSVELSRMESKLKEYKKLDKTEFSALVQEYIKCKRMILHYNWSINEISNL